VTPPNLFFQEVADSKLVNISNVGATDLTVTNLSLSGNSDFTLNAANPATPFVVMPSNTTGIFVDYLPSGVGAVTGTLTIQSNDPDEPEVTVSLFGDGLPE
jgi:hypothetical protein